jgi:fatty acid desaturase
MSEKRDAKNRRQPIGANENLTFPAESLSPKTKGRYGTQNIVVLLGQGLGWVLLLNLIEISSFWPLKLALVLLFCALMQGVFSLMHEFFHDNAHPNPRVNYAIGFIGSLLFGTAATFHRVNHWGHHVRNRTPAEQGEFIHEGESALGKIAIYYFAVLGGLWLFRRFNTYSAAFAQFKAADWTRMRLEALALIIFWGSLFYFGPFRWQTLLLCYGSFALSWSSLQWVYHLNTPLHVVEGAYNLRAPILVRWLFLNFNYNLTHHRRPYLPWQELPMATNLQETQPLWYRWLLILKWPIRFPDDLSFLEKRYF